MSDLHPARLLLPHLSSSAWPSPGGLAAQLNTDSHKAAVFTCEQHYAAHSKPPVGKPVVASFWSALPGINSISASRVVGQLVFCIFPSDTFPFYVLQTVLVFTDNVALRRGSRLGAPAAEDCICKLITIMEKTGAFSALWGTESCWVKRPPASPRKTHHSVEVLKSVIKPVGLLRSFILKTVYLVLCLQLLTKRHVFNCSKPKNYPFLNHIHIYTCLECDE